MPTSADSHGSAGCGGLAPADTRVQCAHPQPRAFVRAPALASIDAAPVASRGRLPRRGRSRVCGTSAPAVAPFRGAPDAASCAGRRPAALSCARGRFVRAPSRRVACSRGVVRVGAPPLVTAAGAAGGAWGGACSRRRRRRRRRRSCSAGGPCARPRAPCACPRAAAPSRCLSPRAARCGRRGWALLLMRRLAPRSASVAAGCGRDADTGTSALVGHGAPDVRPQSPVVLSMP